MVGYLPHQIIHFITLHYKGENILVYFAQQWPFKEIKKREKRRESQKQPAEGTWNVQREKQAPLK